MLFCEWNIGAVQNGTIFFFVCIDVREPRQMNESFLGWHTCMKNQKNDDIFSVFETKIENISKRLLSTLCITLFRILSRKKRKKENRNAWLLLVPWTQLTIIHIHFYSLINFLDENYFSHTLFRCSFFGCFHHFVSNSSLLHSICNVDMLITVGITVNRGSFFLVNLYVAKCVVKNANGFMIIYFAVNKRLNKGDTLHTTNKDESVSMK